MNENIIRAPKFVVGDAVKQVFNLPGGMGYLFRVLGFGSLLFTVLFILLGVPIIRAYVEMFSNLMALENLDSEPDPEEMLEIMGPIFAAMGYIFLLYIGQYFVFVSVETALYKNIIRGEDKGFFPLRFGYDEWRVFGLRLVVGLMLYIAYMVAYFVAIIVFMMFFGLALAGTGGGEPSVGLGIVGGLLFILFIFGFIVAYLYALIRLAPTAAISVRTRDFNPVGSWKIMKSYVWPTLGAVLIIGIIGYIALSIFWLIAVSILIVVSGLPGVLSRMDFESNDAPDFSPLIEQISTAGFIIPSVIILFLMMVVSFLFIGAIWSIWGYIAKLTDTETVLGGFS